MKLLARWVCEQGGNWRLRLGVVIAGFVILASALALILTSSASAAMLPPSGPFPDAPCNLANRMNIFIAEDGTLYECVCEALASGHVCDWFEQGSVSSASLRRRAHVRLRVRVLPRLVVIRV